MLFFFSRFHASHSLCNHSAAFCVNTLSYTSTIGGDGDGDGSGDPETIHSSLVVVLRLRIRLSRSTKTRIFGTITPDEGDERLLRFVTATIAAGDFRLGDNIGDENDWAMPMIPVYIESVEHKQ